MATPSVIRHSLGDPTRSQPVRPWWQQRPPVDIDAAYGTLSISEPTLAVGRARTVQADRWHQVPRCVS